MTRLTLFLFFVVGGLLADGRSEGRRGNDAYREGSYEEAAGAYLKGLAETDEDDRLIQFGLLNNLGAAQYRLQKPSEAVEAFERATFAAAAPEAQARASYNAGNAAFKADDLERALHHYRRALLNDPDNEDAKYNFEFVKRRLQQQGGGQQNQQDQQNQDQQQQNQQDQGGQQNEQQDQQQQDQESQAPDEGQQEQQEQGRQSEPQQPEQSDDEEQQGQGEAAAEAAVHLVRDGMCLGLGSGSTTASAT